MLHELECETPDSLRLTRLECDGETLLVFSHALPGRSFEGLSECELSVVLLAANGRSNQEIAFIRRASVRTVANQLASAYRKLGGASRARLRAFAGGPSSAAENL